MKNSINIFNALNESLEKEFKTKRKAKLKESEEHIDIEALVNKFDENYNFLYNAEGGVAGEEEAVEAFDKYIKNPEFKKYVAAYGNYVGDFISSDREAAAFMFAMEDLGYLDKIDSMSESAEDDYMLLDRLRSDCDYYLGYGNRNPKHLWAGNEQGQIDEMRKIMARLPEKPDWISDEDIDRYEKEMTGIENDTTRGPESEETIKGMLRRARKEAGIETDDLGESDKMEEIVEEVVEEIVTEGQTVTVQNTQTEPDYIISDVTVLDTVGDGDVQSPDIDALLTLIDESLKSEYSNEWGRIKTLSSSKNEAYSYALVDISTPEILKEFEEKGIEDAAIGKNLILESLPLGMFKFKVNNLNGITKYSKVTDNPQQAIYEWVESEFLHEAKEEKVKELEILKTKTEKETIENYIENRIDLRQEIENIKMFIELGKQVKASEEMKPAIQKRMYAFAAEMPHNIEITNKKDKYELSFGSLDKTVEIIFGKQWVKETEEIPEVVELKESEFKVGDKISIDYISDKNPHNGVVGKIKSMRDYRYYPNGNPEEYEIRTQGEIEYEDGSIEQIQDFNRQCSGVVSKLNKMNEAYEQFNIGDIEVVFNPETYECLYSIPSAEVKDKKINLTKVPSVDTPYDTNTIIKSYIETKFGVLPSEEEKKMIDQGEVSAPEQDLAPIPTDDIEVPVELDTELEEDELPEEPTEGEPTSEVPVEDELPTSETGNAIFMKIRPKQPTNIESLRQRTFDGDTPESNYIVVDNIDLNDEDWNDLTSDLTKQQSYLSGIKPIDRKNYSFNVVKLTNAESNFDLLVDPLGYNYPRYIAIIDKQVQ